MAKTRFFRVALEGDTTDGRSIERQWLLDAAETYNRDTYAARVNMEHIRGITADPPFQSLGDVLSLKAEEVTIELAGKSEKRLALFAEIDALEPLVAINRRGQKLFSSIEIAPNFANTGKAYLVGLAVTDSPASLGTELLQFAAAQGEKSPLAHRKQDKANLFTAAQEAVIELAEAPAPDATAGLFAKISAFVDGLTGKTAVADQQQSQQPLEPQQPSAPEAACFAAIGLAIGELASAVQTSAKATDHRIATLAADLKTVTDKVEATPAAFTPRSPATGGDLAVRTDC